MHCWLARSDVGLQAGGFLGDFVKGPLENTDHPEDLKLGLRLHRYIDRQSNQLDSFRQSYARFGTELRRPAPVLTDLIADHIFAKHWDEYGEGSLTEFTQLCYESIGKYAIPASAQRMYDYMCDTDLLARYAQLQVVEDIMQRILKRLKFSHLADHLTLSLREESESLKADFNRYFYDLEQCTSDWLIDLADTPS